MSRSSTNDSSAAETWRDELLCELVPHAVHRMNNLMTVVAGNIEMLAMDETDPGRRQTLVAVEASAKRAMELVKALGLHARSNPGPAEVVDLREVVSNIGELFSPVAKAAGFELSLAESSGVTIARVDQASCQLLILGLLVRAADAGDGLVLRDATCRIRVVELATRVAVVMSFVVREGESVSEPDANGQASRVAKEIGVRLRTRRHKTGLSILVGLDVLS